MTDAIATGKVYGRLDPALDTGFTARSMLRRVAGEPIVALAVMRILVMDVAHPHVGGGVRDHSAFRRIPYRRLWGTADLGLRMVFGDARVARDAAEQIYRFHDHVNGSVGDDSPQWEAHTQYTAHDASLLLWVWATIADSIFSVQERWIEPLNEADADALYADLRSFGLFFGIPTEQVPADRSAFAEYVDGMLDSDALVATPTTVGQVHDVLWFRHPLVSPHLVRVARVLAIGTLDPRLRQRFDLDLDDADQRLFKRLDGFLAEWYPRLPDVRRQLPVLYMVARKQTLRLKKRLGPRASTSPSPR